MEADDELIARALAGNLDAYGAMVDRYRGRVVNLAYRMLGSRDRADDVAQDAFLRAYSALRTFDARRPFLPWVLAITANLCKDHRRRRGSVLVTADTLAARAADTPPPGDPPGDCDPYAALRHEEMQATIHEAVSRLPAPQRLVTVLIHLQGLSYEQVSEILGQPVNTVKSHAHRARLRLRRLLAPHLEEDVT